MRVEEGVSITKDRLKRELEASLHELVHLKPVKVSYTLFHDSPDVPFTNHSGLFPCTEICIGSQMGNIKKAAFVSERLKDTYCINDVESYDTEQLIAEYAHTPLKHRYRHYAVIVGYSFKDAGRDACYAVYSKNDERLVSGISKSMIKHHACFQFNRYELGQLYQSLPSRLSKVAKSATVKIK